eukprot:SAG22_NODE_2393_length_2622_cov_2.419738_5_plen_188_part_00
MLPHEREGERWLHERERWLHESELRVECHRSPGSTAWLATQFASALGTGVYHAAVEVHGTEWSFGGCAHGSGAPTALSLSLSLTHTHTHTHTHKLFLSLSLSLLSHKLTRSVSLSVCLSLSISVSLSVSLSLTHAPPAGVFEAPPKSFKGHTYNHSVYLGDTTLTVSDVDAFVQLLSHPDYKQVSSD